MNGRPRIRGWITPNNSWTEYGDLHGLAFSTDPFLLLHRDHLVFNGRIMAVLMPRATALIAEYNGVARWAVATLAIHTYNTRVLPLLGRAFSWPGGLLGSIGGPRKIMGLSGDSWRER